MKLDPDTNGVTGICEACGGALSPSGGRYEPDAHSLVECLQELKRRVDRLERLAYGGAR
jgi:RNA polymerase-binding transcription factor DksA